MTAPVIPESKHVARDDDRRPARRPDRDGSIGAPDEVPPAAAAADTHHRVLVPVPVLRRLRQEALLPAVQHALLGAVVGNNNFVLVLASRSQSISLWIVTFLQRSKDPIDLWFSIPAK